MASKKQKTPRPSPLPPRRARIYFAIMLLSPLLVLFLLEAALRLAGYGQNLALFATEERGGKLFSVMNPDVKNRYFTHVAFSPNTSHDYFLVPKPEGTYRIFTLGGSTTAGFPYGSPGTFATFLRHRLTAVAPSRRVEVINLGMTATNSYTVLDIARELPAYQPDLVIVYDGHNEFYGALGAASHESGGSSRRLTLAYLRLNRWKTFQLLRSGIEALKEISSGRPAAPVAGGTMMEQLAKNEYIPYGSPLYRACGDNFAANVEETVRVLRDAGVPVVISTQVSNIRSQEPFISGNDPRMAQESVRSYDTDLRRASDALRDPGSMKKIDSAETTVRSLLARDSLRADAYFLLGKLATARGKTVEARTAFSRARDLDELRFRMSADFNNRLRSVAARSGAILADIDSAMAISSPAGAPGNELILEHLHPNLDGVRLMARVYADVIRRNGLFATADEWKNNDTLSETSLSATSSVTALDSAAAARRIATLTSRWPFNRMITLPAPKLPAFAIPVLDRLVEGKSTWEEAHVAFAQAALSAGDTATAIREFSSIIDQLPYNSSGYLILGQLLQKQQRIGEAWRIYLGSLAAEETPAALRALGTIQLDSGHAAAAVDFLRRGLRASAEPRDKAQCGYFLALAHFRDRDYPAAEREIEKVVALSPSSRAVLQLRDQIRSAAAIP